jgi:hypothetical protein
MALMPRADSGTGYRSFSFYLFGFIFLLALGRKIPASQRRSCSYHSPELVSDAEPRLGGVVKEAITATPLLGPIEDRKHVQGNSGDPFQGTIRRIDEVDLTFTIMYIKAFSDHYYGH